MCSSCNDVKKIFSAKIVTTESVSNDMELYKEMACRLFREKVISHIDIGNNRTYVDNNQHIFAFDLHLTNRHDIKVVTLENVEKALAGVLEPFTGYGELKIELV